MPLPRRGQVGNLSMRGTPRRGRSMRRLRGGLVAVTSRSQRGKSTQAVRPHAAVRLVSIGPSPLAHKKLVAMFAVRTPSGAERQKTTHFGAAGYEDFTTHGDEDRRRRYVARHQAREDFGDATSAGALSRWVLWNKRSVGASIADFRRRFRL